MSPYFRLTLAVLVIIAGSMLAFVASAQSVPGSVKLTWTLPTTGCSVSVTPCNNAPLTGDAALTAVEVYISTSPIAEDATIAPTLTLGPGETAATHAMQVANGATLYVRYKAVNASYKSGFSNQLSKLVKVPVQPGVPTAVTIEITIG